MRAEIDDVMMVAAPNPGWQHGVRPTRFNIVAVTKDGREWTHNVVFDDISPLLRPLIKKIDRAGAIDTDHWKPRKRR